MSARSPSTISAEHTPRSLITFREMATRRVCATVVLFFLPPSCGFLHTAQPALRPTHRLRLAPIALTANEIDDPPQPKTDSAEMNAVSKAEHRVCECDRAHPALRGHVLTIRRAPRDGAAPAPELAPLCGLAALRVSADRRGSSTEGIFMRCAAAALRMNVPGRVARVVGHGRAPGWRGSAFSPTRSGRRASSSRS